MLCPPYYCYRQSTHTLNEGHKHAPTVNVPAEDINLSTSWNGKKVAFLGDSMTDPKINPQKIIGKYLETLMGHQAMCVLLEVAINGTASIKAEEM